MVEGFWEQRSEEVRRWRILPTGWVELIFRLGAPFTLERAKLLGPDAEPTRHFCFLSGLHTRPLDMSFSRFHVFGIRLHPVAVRALFGIPCSEVRDGAIEGDLVLGGLAEIEDRLRSAPDFHTRARWMEQELAGRLRNREALGPAEQMRELAERLQSEGRDPGRNLTRIVGYSRSHTHRLFTEWLGQSTTHVIRMTRFVRATRAIHGNSGSLSRIGYQLGYFDQAHFIREFREYSGMTPGEYRRRRGAAPDQVAL
jgi:AraC-like DNA-binding protein